MKRRKKMQDVGSTLILVLISLISISSTAIVFVRSCNKDRLATNNFVADTDARLAAFAGLDHALTATFEAFINGDTLSSPLLYPQSAPELSTAVIKGSKISLQNCDTNNPFSCSGYVGKRTTNDYSGRYLMNGNFYALKIETSAAKLNLNSYIAAKEQNQKISNKILERILQSLAKQCEIENIEGIASRIAYHPIENGNRFFSQQQLQTLLYSFPEKREAIQKFLANLCVHSETMKMVGVFGDHFYTENRTPIDINNASGELLFAIIENIKATFTFYHDDNIRNTLLDFSNQEVNVKKIVNTIQKRIAIHGNFQDFAEFFRFVEENLITCFPPQPQEIDEVLWIAAWQDTLKSNFNCDITNRKSNPNKPSHFVVGKTELFDYTNQLPGHSSEICFFHIAPTTIESHGYITAKDGKFIVAKFVLTTEVYWGKMLRHNSQRDYSRGKFTGTHSLPNNTHWWNKEQGHMFLGGIEPQPKSTPQVNIFSAVNQQNSILFSPNTQGYGLKQNISYYGGAFNLDGTHYQKTAKLPLDKLIQIYSPQPDRNFSSFLTHEGLLNSAELQQKHYYAFTHSFQPKSCDASNIDFRGTNFVKDSNIGNYQGSISLWLKLASFPGTKNKPGIKFALLNSTVKNKRNKFGNHEGIHMSLSIDEYGTVNLSRLYYQYLFTENLNHKIIPYGNLDLVHADPERSQYAWQQVEENISNFWKPYEWHHIIIRWNDMKDDLRLEIDGEICGNKKSITGIGVINEVDPRDVFFINSYFRKEVKKIDNRITSKNVEHFGNATVDDISAFFHEDEATYFPRYQTTTSYQGNFICPQKMLPGPLFWIGYTSHATNTEKYVSLSHIDFSAPDFVTKENAQILIPQKKSVFTKESFLHYQVDFFIGQYKNLGIECPTLGTVFQSLLFCYPSLSNMTFSK